MCVSFIAYCITLEVLMMIITTISRIDGNCSYHCYAYNEVLFIYQLRKYKRFLMSDNFWLISFFVFISFFLFFVVLLYMCVFMNWCARHIHHRSACTFSSGFENLFYVNIQIHTKMTHSKQVSKYCEVLLQHFDFH